MSIACVLESDIPGATIGGPGGGKFRLRRVTRLSLVYQNLSKEGGRIEVFRGVEEDGETVGD